MTRTLQGSESSVKVGDRGSWSSGIGDEGSLSSGSGLPLQGSDSSLGSEGTPTWSFRGH